MKKPTKTVNVINIEGLDDVTISLITNPMRFNRWYYEDDTKFMEIQNAEGGIVRIFPERVENILNVIK